MNDPEWQDTAERLKQGLPVNEELKTKLRSSFVRKGRWGTLWRRAGIAAVLAGALLAGTIYYSQLEPHVRAASLQLANQFVLSEQLGKENSVSVSEYEGITYFALEDLGIYAQRKSGLELIVPGNIRYVRVSPDGTRLLYVQDGSLIMHELETGQSKALLQGSDEQGNYAMPVWSPDGARIAVVQRQESEDGEATTADQLYELDVRKGVVHYIGAGTSPSYAAGKQTLIFERNDTIVSKNLKSGEEKVLDSGKYPAVSHDGAYVAYVKFDGDQLLEDVWIADTDFRTKKKFTHNQLTDAWDRNSGTIVEGEQQAKYVFEQPIWSQDGHTLFVYKVFRTNEVWKKLMRLELTSSLPTPEDIVAGSIEALIYRDEDYAHTFFSYDPGYLKGTSPRQVGYRILAGGKLEDRTYVDAETYLSYAEPYYQIVKNRYYLSDKGEGYKIDHMEELADIELSMLGEDIYRTVNGRTDPQPLVKWSDLPDGAGKWSNKGVSGLVYQEELDTLWLVIERESGDMPALSLISYNPESRQFHEWDTVDGVRSSSMIIVNYNQNYAAIETEVDGMEETIVFDLQRGKKTMLSRHILGSPPESVHTRFWQGDRLIYYAEIAGRDIFFQFVPNEGIK